MVKISVIIPVYNVGSYLNQCLDSLLVQTLSDIEIICINDGSTDNSLEILNDYAKKDNRIKIVNKENEGQGIARNLGIELAQGEFIGFVDPDDWVSPEMYEKMYNQAKKLSSQVVICDYKKYFEDDDKYCDVNIFRNAVSLTKSKAVKFRTEENIDKNLIDKTILVSPGYVWHAIYQAALIKDNDINFAYSRCYEDVIFVLKSHLIAQNISYVKDVFYYYRIRKSSTLRSYDNRYADLIDTIKLIRDYLIRTDSFETLRYNFNYFCLANIYRVFVSTKSEKARRKLLILSEEILDKKLLKALQKKFFTSLKLLNELLNVSGTIKQKLGNLLYYRKYL